MLPWTHPSHRFTLVGVVLLHCTRLQCSLHFYAYTLAMQSMVSAFIQHPSTYLSKYIIIKGRNSRGLASATGTFGLHSFSLATHTATFSLSAVAPPRIAASSLPHPLSSRPSCGYPWPGRAAPSRGLASTALSAKLWLPVLSLCAGERARVLVGVVTAAPPSATAALLTAPPRCMPSNGLGGRGSKGIHLQGSL
jgi:hypothetical protein